MSDWEVIVFLIAGRVTHDRSPGLKAGNKNRVERLHRARKGRYHGMRGLRNPETGHAILKGFIIQHNYLRPHESLDGVTPAEASGTKLPFEDGWANPIEWATIHTTRINWPPDETDEPSDNWRELRLEGAGERPHRALDSAYQEIRVSYPNKTDFTYS